MNQIRSRIMKGAFWNAVAQYGSQVINMAALVILARLLGPGDFGGIAMALLFISFLGIFCEAGLVSALIQKQDVTEEDRCVAFWGQTLLSICICLFTLIAAPLVAIFFRDERLTLVMRCLAVLFLLMPLNAIPEALETKKLKYNLIAVAELIGSFAGSAVAVWMAMQNKGLWSLVGLELVKRSVRGVVLMALVGWRPSFLFSMRTLVSLFHGGKRFTLKNLIYYFADSVDGFLIGRMLGPAALGLYEMGYKVPSFPVTKIWNMFGAMLFPAFSMMEREPVRLKANLLRVSWLGGFFLNPFILMIFFGAEPIVRLVIGPQWIEIVPIAQLFCVLMIATGVSFGDESLLLALGRVPVVTGWKLVFSAAIFVTGIAAIHFGGLVWLTASFVTCSVLHILVVKFITFRALGLKWSAFFSSQKTVVVVTALSLIAQWVYASLFPTWAPVFFVAGQLLLSLLVLVPFTIWGEVVDLKNRKINLERIAAFSS